MDQSSPRNDSLQHLAASYQAQGERVLLQGDLNRALECFDAAIKLEPQQAKLYYAQGLALFEHGSTEGQEKILPLASKKFKVTITLQPDHFETWQAWGSLLQTLGTSTGEHHYFLDAKEKIEKAIALSEGQSKDTLADLYWNAGLLYSHLAEHSEEPHDWHQAMEMFQKSHALEEKPPLDFWKDFGHACLKFAAHINDIRFYVKAASCFKNALAIDSTACECWCLLGDALQKLYSYTHDEDHFSQASDCFSTASQLEPQNDRLYLKWARLLCNAAKQNPDMKRLRMSIEKCQRAFALNPSNPVISATWGEALSLLGCHAERLDLIFDAQNKILHAVDADENNPDIWYSYGVCMQAFGHYFEDSDYYYQAVEKFQEGISIDRTCDRHWHAIGWTYSLIGDLDHHPETLELSLRFYQKAIDLQASTYYIFDYASALSKLGEITHEQRWLEEAVVQFERLLHLQKNAIYLHPDWLFQYASTLDALGDFHEEEFYYLRAIDIFSHVLMIDPDFSDVHHRQALALSHLGELTSEVDHFYRAIHHYKLALKSDEENDAVILDWATTLMNIAGYAHNASDTDQLYREAEHKLFTALRLGNAQAYYHLSCLYSLMGECEKGMHALCKGQEYDALPPVDEMLQDEWLENLRSTGDFQEFLTRLDNRRNVQEER